MRIKRRQGVGERMGGGGGEGVREWVEGGGWGWSKDRKLEGSLAALKV